MSELKLKQLQYETETWKRLLSFLREENIHLKYRLSEVLKNEFDKSLLEQMECFQNSFIKEDDLIGLLRNGVAELDSLLVWEVFENRKSGKDIHKKLVTLRNNIDTAEKYFARLKLEFISYLSENI